MSFNTARIHFKEPSLTWRRRLRADLKKRPDKCRGGKLTTGSGIWSFPRAFSFSFDDALSLLNLPNTSRVRWERETEHSFSLLWPRWNYQGKEELLQCAGLIFEAICNEYFGLGLFRSVVDLKSKISDRNNMAFYFCLRDFLSAIFMYHSVVTNSYSSSKPILQQES